MKTVKAGQNLFAEFGYNEEETEDLQKRSRMIIAIRRYINENEMTQEHAAGFFRTEANVIDDVMEGRIDKLSYEVLKALMQKGLDEMEASSI